MIDKPEIKEKKRGRRAKNDANTREDLIQASLQVFARNGLKNASIREIAKEAKIDSALIYHYFNTKEDLFFEAIKSKMQPPDKSKISATETPQERATRITSMFFERFNESDTSSAFLALMKSALQNEEAAELLRKLFEEHLISYVSSQFDSQTANLRVSLGVSILLGLNFVRYILKLEPLSSMEDDRVAKVVAPLLAPMLLKDFPNNTFINQ